MEKKKVTIPVNGQQYRLVKELTTKGEYGKTDGEVVLRGFDEWGRRRRLVVSKK
jgi:asparagine synthetase B (glutamine-hydrolysing)